MATWRAEHPESDYWHTRYAESMARLTGADPETFEPEPSPFEPYSDAWEARQAEAGQ